MISFGPKSFAVEFKVVESFVLPTKGDIRREMSDRRRGVPGYSRIQKSLLIARRLEGLNSYHEAQTILFFMSLAEEVQSWEMIVSAFQQGKKVCLPVMDREARQIRITYLPKLDIEFEEKSYGIKEPNEVHWDFKYSEGIDLVVVPGLAFDLSGGRIGFGGGYYDRLLKTLIKDIDAIGVAFDFQVFQSIPQTSRDEKVHTIITEKRVHFCR